MVQNLNDLKAEFIKINQGLVNTPKVIIDNKVWYQSHRRGDTGIGKTFEDLLGKKEDNFQLPDYENIELKAHLDNNSLITLFTKSPNLPRGINTIIREKYGYSDDDTGIKVLHSTVPSGKLTFNAKSQHYFTVVDDPTVEAVKLAVYGKNKQLIPDDVQAKWTYSAITKALNHKMPDTLAVIKANKKKSNKKIYYNYKSIWIAKVTPQIVINALNNGTVYVDLRMGAYKSGPKKGKNHDHGTGFRISWNNLLKYAHAYELVNNKNITPIKTN